MSATLKPATPYGECRLVSQLLCQWAEENPRAAVELLLAVGDLQGPQSLSVPLTLGADAIPLEELESMVSDTSLEAVALFDHYRSTLDRRVAHAQSLVR